MAKSIKVIHSSGKRKTAIARATLKQGKGVVRINSLNLKEYGNEIARLKIMEPLILAENVAKKVDIKVKVKGGGWSSQANAARLAIARGLVKFDKNLKDLLEGYDRSLLIADIRRKEKYKPNDSKARRKRQTSYR